MFSAPTGRPVMSTVNGSSQAGYTVEYTPMEVGQCLPSQQRIIWQHSAFFIACSSSNSNCIYCYLFILFYFFAVSRELSHLYIVNEAVIYYNIILSLLAYNLLLFSKHALKNSDTLVKKRYKMPPMDAVLSYRGVCLSCRTVLRGCAVCRDWHQWQSVFSRGIQRKSHSSQLSAGWHRRPACHLSRYLCFSQIESNL